MSKIWLATLLLLVATGFLHPASAASRQALLIGISDYTSRHQGDQMFPDLDCDEDLARIRLALKTTFGFEDADIVTLSGPKNTVPTRAAILAALDKLIQQTGPGDIVFIHYSGHGDQAPDSAKPTGLDYALVPCDYKATAQRATTTEAGWEATTNEIRGKTLGGYIQRLADKGPAQITLSFDSCHSGQPTRGLEKKRGVSYEEANRFYQDHFHVSLPTPKTRGQAGAVPAGFIDSPLPDNVVVLSACTSDQFALETNDHGKDMGRFSYVLAQALATSAPDTAYEQVYQKVRAIFREKGFADDQDPQVDGNTDLRLLGGIGQPPAPTIPVLGGVNGHYTLDAGQLQGVTRQSLYAIYPNGATDFSDRTKIADARVTSVDIATSDLVLTEKYPGDLKSEALLGAQAIESKHSYEGRPIVLDPQSVRASLPDGDDVLASLRQQVKNVSFDGTPDLKLVKGANGVYLARADDGLKITDIPTAADPVQAVCQAIERVARYDYALHLENPPGESPAHISFRIIAALPPTSDGGRVAYSGDDPAKAGKGLHVGDWFTIEVTNHDSQDYHIALLDLVSSGDVAAIWPDPDYRGQDNILPGNSSKRLWVEDDATQYSVFQASSPDPREYFKIVGTDDYVSYRALATRGGSRGPDSPFSDLLGPAVDAGARSVQNTTFLAPASWATATMKFVIAP